MSCHDWRELLAHRFDPELEAPAEWPQASLHLEDCAACRLEATRRDPTLVFRNAAAWSPDGSEFEAIRSAVRTLRRTGELSARTTSAHVEARDRDDRGRRAVSVVLLAVALAMLPAGTTDNGVDRAELSLSVSNPRILRMAGPAAPAIEGVDRPEARVYEWGADDLSVVMVVDESLDV